MINMLPLVFGQVRFAQGLFQGPFRAPFMIHLLVEFGLQHEGFIMTVVLRQLGSREPQGVMVVALACRPAGRPGIGSRRSVRAGRIDQMQTQPGENQANGGCPYRREESRRQQITQKGKDALMALGQRDAYRDPQGQQPQIDQHHRSPDFEPAAGTKFQRQGD